MDKKTVDFYFAYLSPYSYLANERIQQELSPLGVTLRYKPIGHSGSGDGPAINPTRYDYIVKEDVPRYSREMDVNFVAAPQLTESHSASRGFLYAQRQGAGDRFNTLVFRARWGEGQDISDRNLLGSIAKTVGLDRREFLAALDDPLYEDQMSVIAQDAARAGVFGAPTFVYDTKRFWGNDRMEWLVKELTALPGE